MRIRIAVALLLILGVAGCTDKLEPAASPDVSATSPGPIALTDDEAGVRYLSVVCQPNAALASLLEVLRAGDDADIAAINAAGAEALRTARLAIEVLDDTRYVWPAGVAEHVPHIRAAYVLWLSSYDMIANAPTVDEAYSVEFAELTQEQRSAGQEIRLRLGLAADTATSCVGYETKLDSLHDELIQRDEPSPSS